MCRCVHLVEKRLLNCTLSNMKLEMKQNQIDRCTESEYFFEPESSSKRL